MVVIAVIPTVRAGLDRPEPGLGWPLGDRLLESGTAAQPSAASWTTKYVRRLVVGDAVVIAGSVVTASVVRPGAPSGISYGFVSVLVLAAWLVCLAAGRAYEPRFLGCGSEEYRRVATSALHLAGGMAVVAVALRIPLARSFIAAAVVLGCAGLLVHRFAARRVLYRARERGRDSHRVLVLGDNGAARALVETVRREPRAGFHVIGTITDWDRAVELARDAKADTIAVTASTRSTPERLRRLAWQLEGTGIELIVAPALTDVAGPRVSIRPVAGLPLLHVEQPDITGARYLLKEIVERALALAVLICALPLMLLIAIGIVVTSPGPVFFTQTRVSRHGREFQIYKFRSMRVDAEALLDTLREQNDAGDGLLFKLRKDPRVTSLGRLLRRLSLDELPQLLNVVRGDMALVGPRPPLPVEAAGYTGGVQRRLLVKPGMTGLWQVSGRSDLSWEESVRLDLYYVENWSLALDAQIIVRTLRAVVAGTGAY